MHLEGGSVDQAVREDIEALAVRGADRVRAGLGRVGVEGEGLCRGGARSALLHGEAAGRGFGQPGATVRQSVGMAFSASEKLPEAPWAGFRSHCCWCASLGASATIATCACGTKRRPTNQI